MAPDPLRARTRGTGRNSPSTPLALKVTTMVYNPPPLSKIPGSAQGCVMVINEAETCFISIESFTKLRKT